MAGFQKDYISLGYNSDWYVFNTRFTLTLVHQLNIQLDDHLVNVSSALTLQFSKLASKCCSVDWCLCVCR